MVIEGKHTNNYYELFLYSLDDFYKPLDCILASFDL